MIMNRPFSFFRSHTYDGIILLVLIQILLSRQKHWIYGAILPILEIIYTYVLVKFGKLAVNPDSLFPNAAAFVGLLAIWAMERYEINEKLKKQEVNNEMDNPEE